MKKILAILLSMMLVLSLVACGGGNDTPAPSNNEDKTPSSSEQQEQQDSNDDEQPSNASDDGDNNVENATEPLSIDPALLAEKAELYRLPGLTLPENSTAEFDDAMGKFMIIRNEDFTEDDLHAYAQVLWELCSGLSPDGIYKGEVVGGELRKHEEYSTLEETWMVDRYLWYYTCGNECVMLDVKLFSSWADGETITVTVNPGGVIE